jgi:FHS family L-fucose permease-like MFS transporter
LAILSSSTTGAAAATSIVAIGLFNSIMFPTIFALALEKLGDDKPEGSGMLCMAIVGGAIIPLITGAVADSRGLAFSLLVPAACYAWIAFYGAHMSRKRVSGNHADDFV